MTQSLIDITDGPSKDALLRAVANDDGLLTTIFDTPAGSLEAQIVKMEERGMDGVDYVLTGQLAETSLEGAYFTAAYNCETRTGTLTLQD
jgi:hypothetical protein